MFTTLKTLCSVPSVSGREDKIRNTIKELVAPLCDEVYTDNLGNLIAKKASANKEAKNIMLCAHMDEIGFLVTFIEDNGAVRVAPVGGIHSAAVAYTEVVSESGVPGVIVPCDDVKAKDYALDKFYIDLGAKNKKKLRERPALATSSFVAHRFAVLLAQEFAADLLTTESAAR